jgi:sensor c-di-GMP phosphodiesterase-like protein
MNVHNNNEHLPGVIAACAIVNMRRFRLALLVIGLTLMTALGPPLLSLYLARQQGLTAEQERVRGYADVVLLRSDRAVSQMQQAIDALVTGNAGDVCSDSMLLRMRQLSLLGEFLKAVGAVAGNQLLCSSLGLHEPPIDLGDPAEITALGTALRYTAPLLEAEGVPYISIARDGFIAMAHRNQAVDMALGIDGAILATFNPLNGELRTASGDVRQEWISRVADRRSIEFVDDGYVVAVLLSDQVTLTGAIAAVPLRYLDERVRQINWRLLPFSLLAALILTLGFLYLARQQVSMASQIRQGLRRDEFYLEYQPVIELATGRWSGAEALLRWQRRNGEVIYPDVFIPVAENSGLITRLSERVIARIERDMAGFLREHPLMMIAMNFSANDMQVETTVQHLFDMIERNGLGSGQIMVELTERMLVDPERARQLMVQLNEHNIQVAVDDFGTGYSSLSYLESMPFDCLKIDRLFVEAIDRQAATSRVVLHIIEMASALGLNVVAEGVETDGQARFLKEHGVRYAQGWLYSQSLRAEDFIAGYSEQLNE